MNGVPLFCLIRKDCMVVCGKVNRKMTDEDFFLRGEYDGRPIAVQIRSEQMKWRKHPENNAFIMAITDAPWIAQWIVGGGKTKNPITLTAKRVCYQGILDLPETQEEKEYHMLLGIAGQSENGCFDILFQKNGIVEKRSVFYTGKMPQEGDYILVCSGAISDNVYMARDVWTITERERSF